MVSEVFSASFSVFQQPLSQLLLQLFRMLILGSNRIAGDCRITSAGVGTSGTGVKIVLSFLEQVITVFFKFLKK